MNEIEAKNEMDPVVLFRKRVEEKLADDIGKLMPDEMIQKLVAEAINGILYKEIYKNGNQYNKIPFVQDEVEKLIGEKVRVMVGNVIKDKEEEIFNIIVEQAKEKFPLIVGTIFLSLMNNNAQSMSMTVMNDIRNFMMNNKGMY